MNAADSRRRFKVISYLLKGFICFAAIASFGYAFSIYISEDERFRVREIRVIGANVLREQTIVQAADIRADDNVLFVENETIRGRVMSIPYIRSCDVQRVYPGTIIIRIEERVPLATLLVNNHAYEVDAEAMVLRELDPLPPHEGPLITGLPDLPAVEPGKKLENATLAKALELWQAFSLLPVAGQLTVSEIAAMAPNDLQMYCNEVPYMIRWGRSDFTRQAALFDIWWRDKATGAPCKEYLDLRFDDDLVCR